MSDREFNFLPELPKPDLDDRTFQELVNECLLRIPRYCPEWTNYNPSDPGITLVELFAWLTDQMLLRFNQVPVRNYITFLELLGVNRAAPTPAQSQVTFYLSTSSRELPENARTIPAGTEVATERTETEEAVIFATDAPLEMGQPTVRHFLTATTDIAQPQVLRDRLDSSWRQELSGEWLGSPVAFFEEQPQPGNCFYLVLEPHEPITGNVIALTFKGEAATSTGINPQHPPRRWEAWNGKTWQNVLLAESDDATEGFSFSKVTREGGDPAEVGADVELHLPLNFPVETFVTYQGRWLRCVYTQPQGEQRNYDRSPRILSIAARAIGGTMTVTQSTRLDNEFVGESDGNPGQFFTLPRSPILPRREDEYIEVTPVGGLPQIWQEVSDFAESSAEDRHYTLDSITGRVQFGPLIREPAQIQELTQFRDRLQRGQSGALIRQNEVEPAWQALKRQYGAIPARGARIRMVAYRTGGGQQGNVQIGQIQVLKSAVPYIARLENHQPGRNGTNTESLDAAVMRVPKMLRTRDRAVTKEDFETLAIQAGGGAVARALCLPARMDEPGRVRLLLVPQVNTDAIALGMNPDQFSLPDSLKYQVSTYLDERRLLGIEVLYDTPQYVGVSVQTEVALEPEYSSIQALQHIQTTLLTTLYRFLNPVTGGTDGCGWVFGRPLYTSDIVKLFQTVEGVRFLGTVQLFQVLQDSNGLWQRSSEPLSVINPGSLGLICSWSSRRSSHVLNLIEAD
ncbi:MAG: putative baseplate assembly protein [Jaaginema sp. PMC 1079.18]|nr:putative baseplate assembly protein [Jaaginema sp. PMC 1080.18]MEC4851275.1 putative baseplate assembly protein [Jaaginema sp. PMC 1079.18]MEC4867606.1 putative baseplate assembly protein [Jaaginema sp. PMC 1078.18]